MRVEGSWVRRSHPLPIPPQHPRRHPFPLPSASHLHTGLSTICVKVWSGPLLAAEPCHAAEPCLLRARTTRTSKADSTVSRSSTTKKYMIAMYMS